MQVFDFIMDSLDKYRELHQRMEQLVADGMLSPAGLRDSVASGRHYRQARICPHPTAMGFTSG